MSHDHHDALPGYSAQQLLHDGCAECEARAARPNLGITDLNPIRFRHAWARACAWNKGQLGDVAVAETPMLSALWAVQIMFERLGIAPIGQLPPTLTELADQLTAALTAGGD